MKSLFKCIIPIPVILSCSFAFAEDPNKEEAKHQCHYAMRGFISAINPNYAFLNGHLDRWKFKYSKDKRSLIGKAKKYIKVEGLKEDEVRDVTCTYYIYPGEVINIGISKPLVQN